MPWTERQHAMLQLLGLRVWSPPMDATGVEAAAGEAEPIDDRPAPPPPPPAVRASTPAPRREPALEPALEPTLEPAADDGGARAQRIAGLGWPQLREAVSACRACGLCASRRQTVFGVGSHRARWMVVGEAPGEQEDRQGEPFVGPAGRLLDQMLAALGLSRADDGGEPEARVYIANTLKCRPPGNRNPSPDELAHCQPFLVRQVELLQPKLILAMGRFAVQSLLETDEAIGKLRGRVHRWRGVPVVVTYHPAYLLRSLPDKAKAWQDLCLAAEVAEGGAGRA